ncbi:hypothetical protein OF001_U240077 [Pseudomonas sp. OF001]|nr:hypothetical protein OF001_U240077 [Pseudomonas sp. OF001]
MFLDIVNIITEKLCEKVPLCKRINPFLMLINNNPVRLRMKCIK